MKREERALRKKISKSVRTKVEAKLKGMEVTEDFTKELEITSNLILF